MFFDTFRQWQRRSLANTFAIRAALVSVTSVLLVASVSLLILYWMEHRAVESALQHDAATAVTRVEAPLKVVASGLAELAHSPMFATALLDSGGRAAYARPFLQNYRFPVVAANGLALCDINGHLLAGSQTLADCSPDQPAFGQVLTDGQQRQVWQLAPGRRQWIVYQGVTFAYTGTTEGVLVARIDLDDLLQPLAGELNLAEVILRPATGADESSMFADTLWLPLFKGEATADGAPLELVVKARPQSLWALMLPLLSAYLLATLILLVVVMWWVRRESRKLIVPLVLLRDRAREIAVSQDLSLTIPQAGESEVGQLAESIAAMVTALRDAQFSRQEAEARFRLIYDKSDEAIIFAWPDGRIDSANAAACSLFCYSEKEFRALGRAGIMDTSDARLVPALEQRSRTGTFRGELRCRRADGLVFPVDIVSTLFFDAQGVPRTSSLFRDITERKQQEEALRLSESRFRIYFELGLIGMAITSVDKGWVQVNDCSCSILGYPHDELITKTWAELTHPDDLAEDAAQFNRVLNKEIEAYALNKRFISKDGRTVPAAISVKCLRKADGSIDYFVAMVQDISERIEAERRQATLSRHLVKVQEDARRRLARELHDRTSPNLAAIGINLETAVMILDEHDGHDGRLVAERLGDSRALLEDTAIGIREICSDLRPPALDYAGLVPAIETYADQLSRRTGMAITFEHGDQGERAPAEVESMLFRIVQEALTNTAKHAQARSASIRLSLDAQSIVVRVRDDGGGFAPDPAGGHRGLGLINMREMTEFMGGRFSIESQPGQGTCICVEIARDGARSE